MHLCGLVTQEDDKSTAALLDIGKSMSSLAKAQEQSTIRGAEMAKLRFCCNSECLLRYLRSVTLGVAICAEFLCSLPPLYLLSLSGGGQWYDRGVKDELTPAAMKRGYQRWRWTRYRDVDALPIGNAGGANRL